VRSSNKEIDERLTPPREMSLDQCIEYLRDDELLEVTPKSLRIRKRILDARTRGREENALEALSRERRPGPRTDLRAGTLAGGRFRLSGSCRRPTVAEQSPISSSRPQRLPLS
jgi:hypothetical protein